MRILLTGGSACGKSTYGEALAAQLPLPRYYIAAMRPYNDACYLKIGRHRKRREEKGFTTIERQTELKTLVLPQRGTALLECMCNLTANEMFDEKGNIRDVYGDILDGIIALEAQCDNLIVVTNDVGSDCRAQDESTRQYVEMLGRLNTALATRFDCVYELVCGIPVVIKGTLL